MWAQARSRTWTRVLGSAVVNGTHARVGESTPVVPALVTGRRARLAARAFPIALLVAAGLHAPLAPGLIPGWLRRLLRAEEVLPPLPDEVIVPIDLDMGFVDEPPPEEPDAAPARAATADIDDDDEDAEVAKEAALEKLEASRKARELESERQRKKQKDEEIAKAAASAAASASAAPVASAAPSATGSSTPAPPRHPTPMEDPAKLAGGAGAIQAKATNVMIYMATDIARKHELGPLLGDLLAKIPQWNELLGGTDLDPIRDFDHIWLTGPHMQSAKVVVAVVEYNVGVGRMQRAIEQAMKRSKPAGKWLAEKPVPLGVLGNGGTQRVALRPDKRAIIVAPAEAESQLRQPTELRFNKSGSTLMAMTMRTPWRGFMRTAVKFPKSISLLKLTLTPTDKGFLLRIEANDATPESATTTARELAASIEEFRDPPVLAPWFDRPAFTIDGAVVRAEVLVTTVQVKRILNLVSGLLAFSDP